MQSRGLPSFTPSLAVLPRPFLLSPINNAVDMARESTPIIDRGASGDGCDDVSRVGNFNAAVANEQVYERGKSVEDGARVSARVGEFLVLRIEHSASPAACEVGRIAEAGAVTSRPGGGDK